jgi:hypothetical protein
VELHQHLEVIMHLLFLGVVKTTIQMIQEWTKNKFGIEITLESIQYFQLDWCRGLSYNAGKLGGCVSENYLAAARLLPWLFSRLYTDI